MSEWTDVESRGAVRPGWRRSIPILQLLQQHILLRSREEEKVEGRTDERTPERWPWRGRASGAGGSDNDEEEFRQTDTVPSPSLT